MCIGDLVTSWLTSMMTMLMPTYDPINILLHSEKYRFMIAVSAVPNEGNTGRSSLFMEDLALYTIILTTCESKKTYFYMQGDFTCWLQFHFHRNMDWIRQRWHMRLAIIHYMVIPQIDTILCVIRIFSVFLCSKNIYNIKIELLIS